MIAEAPYVSCVGEGWLKRPASSLLEATSWDYVVNTNCRVNQLECTKSSCPELRVLARVLASSDSDAGGENGKFASVKWMGQYYCSRPCLTWLWLNQNQRMQERLPPRKQWGWLHQHHLTLHIPQTLNQGRLPKANPPTIEVPEAVPPNHHITSPDLQMQVPLRRDPHYPVV